MKVVTILLFSLWSILAFAQAPATQAPAQATPTTVTAPAASSETVAVDTYSYDPRGRRDPFLSLLKNPNSSGRGGCNEEIIACLLIDEIDIQGIWKIKGEWIAEVQGKNSKVYWLKEGDVLRDGEVTHLDGQSITFRQKVNDPTRIKPFREVIRSLNEDKLKGRSQ